MISLRSTLAVAVDATRTIAAAARAAAIICVLTKCSFIVRKVAHLTGCYLFTR